MPETPPRETVQGELFVRSVVVHRHLEASGTTFRLRLEDLGDGMVRLLEAGRRARGARRFESLSGEVGRVVRFDRLRLAVGYETLFGRDR